MMFQLWKRSNDLVKYCAGAAAENAQTQKDLKRVNTSGNTSIQSRLV